MLLRALVITVALLSIGNAGRVERDDAADTGDHTLGPAMHIMISGDVRVTLVDPLGRFWVSEPESTNRIPGWSVSFDSQPMDIRDTLMTPWKSVSIDIERPALGKYQLQLYADSQAVAVTNLAIYNLNTHEDCFTSEVDSLDKGLPRTVEFVYTDSPAGDSCRIALGSIRR